MQIAEVIALIDVLSLRGFAYLINVSRSIITYAYKHYLYSRASKDAIDKVEY